MAKTGLIELLDRLEGIIEDSKKMPLTNKVLVDAYDVLELLDKIRISLPDEVKKAEELLKERDRIIAEATREAENLRGSASEYLKSMVSEEEIVKCAEIEAKRILDQAERDGEDIRNGASQYAAEVLLKLDDNLDRALQVIRRGVEELKKSST
ncbi:MAG TPA: ATPase [Bacillota bacterium]|nr:ATPase [Bacillota bacterium]